MFICHRPFFEGVCSGSTTIVLTVRSTRHRKTHDREDGGSDAPGLYNSDEDLEGDESLGQLDDGSPDPDARDLHGSMAHLTSMSSMSSMTMTGLGIPSATLAAPSQLVNPHSHAALLQQTI